MKAEFRQELNRRIMLIKRHADGKNSFEEKMALKNSIRGTAAISIRHLNGESFYTFDMSSCQTLKNAFEGKPMSFKELKSLLTGINAAACELEKYLLDIRGLLMDPEYIFWDLKKEEPLFCYYPENTAGDAGFLALGEFLMDTVDKKDERASETAYSYFDRISEGLILPGDLSEKQNEPEENREGTGYEENAARREWETDPSFRGPEFSGDTRSQDEGNYYMDDTREESAEKKEEDNPLFFILAFIPAFLSAAVYAVIFMQPGIMASLGLSDGDYVRFGAGVTVFSAAFITAGVYIWNNMREREEKKKNDLDSLNSDVYKSGYVIDELEQRALGA